MNELEPIRLFSLDLQTKSYASEYGCLYIVAANSIAEAQEIAIKHYIGDHRRPETRDDIEFSDSRVIGVPMPQPGVDLLGNPMPGTPPSVVSHFVT